MVEVVYCVGIILFILHREDQWFVTLEKRQEHAANDLTPTDIKNHITVITACMWHCINQPLIMYHGVASSVICHATQREY